MKKGLSSPHTPTVGPTEKIKKRQKDVDDMISSMIKENTFDLSKWKKAAVDTGNLGVMKGVKGYKSRGFGTDARWDTRFKRVGVSDTYVKKIREAEEEVRRLDEEEERKVAKQKSTFGHSPQFTLFNSNSKTPGPGSYQPEKPPARVSGNIKLGHRTTIPGGRGIDGEAVGDDDSYTNPGGFRVRVGLSCECKDAR